MNCQLRAGNLSCNWSMPSYFIMGLCGEFNPKTLEYYEFDNPLQPNTPTYMHGISKEALAKGYEICPKTYPEYLKIQAKVAASRIMDDKEFQMALDFLKDCIEQEVDRISCSH